MAARRRKRRKKRRAWMGDAHIAEVERLVKMGLRKSGMKLLIA